MAKDQRYYGTPREEVMDHLPAPLNRMLDLGCGTGATIAALKARYPQLWAAGVEYVPEAANRAREITEQLWNIDVEKTTFETEIPPQSLDLILCMDVLEHLVDPWAVVKRLSPLLRDGGRMIISVPNIRNWKFIFGLLLRGNFIYKESGLLDRTHLRFFVFETAAELAQAGGLTLASCESAQKFNFPDARWFLMKLSLGALEPLLAKQILVVVEKR